MNIIELFEKLQTEDQATEYLEKVRWQGEPHCPYCGSLNCGRHASSDRARQRWQCRDCTRAFSVKVGTLFHGTHVPLRNWFLVLALMLNAKRNMSAYQIARDLGMRRATVWSMMQRIRTAMSADNDQKRLLYGIVEADVTSVGGKPPKGNRRGGGSGGEKPKRCRGATKVPELGAVERGRKVVAKVASPGYLSGRGTAKFTQERVDPGGTVLVTDKCSCHNRARQAMFHAVVNHTHEYAGGLVHTNTIEGFWAAAKRAWYGSHHHYSRKYLPRYVAEACIKYSRRVNDNAFDGAVRMFVGSTA